MSRIVTFRGLIGDGGQDTITLHTNDGAKGYRIIKFELIPEQPFIKNQESTVKIYKIRQSLPVNATTDFSNNTLLGVSLFKQRDDSTLFAYDTVMFDREIFNQDIYVTHFESFSDNSVNYYIELEQVALDLNESTVATLKNMRNKSTPG